jgi:hypothetical protein
VLTIKLGALSAIRPCTPIDHTAEVTVLNEIADKVLAAARTEILNAVAVLRDRWEREEDRCRNLRRIY